MRVKFDINARKLSKYGFQTQEEKVSYIIEHYVNDIRQRNKSNTLTKCTWVIRLCYQFCFLYIKKWINDLRIFSFLTNFKSFIIDKNTKCISAFTIMIVDSKRIQLRCGLSLSWKKLIHQWITEKDNGIFN